MALIGQIDWIEFPTSTVPISPEAARAALDMEKSLFGYSIEQWTPEGRRKILLDGQWRIVSPAT